MIYDVPEAFQAKLDDFNASQGGPTKVAVCWNPKKERWNVFALPSYPSSHPQAKHDRAKKLLIPFPDGTNREGVLLFSWCERDLDGNDIGFAHLDDRIFQTLRWADTFRSRRHYEETIEEPEERREVAEKKAQRAVVGAGASYWRALDSLTISMNPNTRAGGSWRHRIR